VPLFLLVTFLVTWGAWWLASAATPGVFGIGGPIFLFGVITPGLTAVALTAVRRGGEGVRELLLPIGRWQVDPRLYLFALAYMPAIRLAAAAAHRLATGSWPAFGETSIFSMFAGILVSTWMQAGEEVGWRGFLLPRLSDRVGPEAASLLVGIIWAVWHVPLFLIPGTGSDGQSFPIYLLHVTALSVAMTWLFRRSGGSLLLVMVMHAAVNNTTGLVPGATPGAADPWTFSASIVSWATVASAWAVALVLLPRLRAAGSPAPSERVR
jgi:membrane protease YdiL (CAAX protease family)